MQRVYRTVFFYLWKAPLRAFTTVDRYRLGKYEFYLFALFGLARGLAKEAYQIADAQSALLLSLVKAILPGIIGGFIGLLFLSLLLYGAGKLIKGKASFGDISNMIAYAVALPAAGTLLITVPTITILRLKGYHPFMHLQSWTNLTYAIIKINSSLTIGLDIYLFCLLAIGLAVAQEFSLWKSILNIAMVVAGIFLLETGVMLLAG